MRNFNLTRTHLVVLWCIVSHRSEELARLEALGYSPDEQNGLAKTLGIVGLWGGSYRMERTYRMIVQDKWVERLIPDGCVNRFILKHHLGEPLFHSAQFYPLLGDLVDAGLVIQATAPFAATDKGRTFAQWLHDHKPVAAWPIKLPVEAGKVMAKLAFPAINAPRDMI